jgi:HSP20 family molecular chaperone IbpA
MKATAREEHGAASVQWSPLDELHEVRNGVGSTLGSGLIDENSKPRFDVVERQEEHMIKAELPGVNQDEVCVFLDGGILTISGRRKLPGTEAVRRAAGVQKNGKYFLTVLPSQSRLRKRKYMLSTKAEF